MQHIQDKDFDQMFKDHFEDAEIQPSAELWNNIKKEIKPKRRTKFPVLWMAAASVLVTVGILVFFSDSRHEKIELQGKTEAMANVAPPKVASPDQQNIGETKSDAGVLPEDKSASISETQVALSNKSVINKASAKKQQVVRKEEKSLLAMQPNERQSHLLNTESERKQAEIRPTEIQQPAVQELPVVQVGVAALANPAGNALTDELPGVDSEDTEPAQTGRLRIRNAGDLVNFVVDKLDKRDQKILEFRTDEDDNTSLVAINIGPLKLNARKHK